MDENQFQRMLDLAHSVRSGLRILSGRIISVIALTLTSAIFAWTIWADPTWPRIAAAALFGLVAIVLVFASTFEWHRKEGEE